MDRRGILGALLSLPVLAGLAGCGFTPLYATGGLSGQMALISVEAPEGRTAYLLREQLDDALARDRSHPAAYRLALTLTEQRDPRGLGPSNTASRYELSLDVHYVLTEITGGKELRTGDQKVLISYPAVTPPYAGVVAQQDGQQHAAAEAARRIRLDLSQYFLKSKT